MASASARLPAPISFRMQLRRCFSSLLYYLLLAVSLTSPCQFLPSPFCPCVPLENPFENQIAANAPSANTQRD